MILTIACGGGSALLMALGLLLALPDMAGSVSGKVADPASAALAQALGPVGSKATLACLLAVVISATASIVASTSRLLFSLARDRLIAGHAVLSRIDPRRSLPIPALVVVLVLTLLVLSIGFASADAATQIVSFATAGIYTAFQMVVGASLLAALGGRRPAGAFRLGRFGLPVRLTAFLFGIAAVVNLSWPRTPEAGWFANWFIVISIALIIATGLLQMVAQPANRPVTRPAE